MGRITGQISFVDLTDSRSLIAYIASSNRRQVIYDPNTGEYFPNYSVNPNTLFPELYIAGGGDNIINQAKSVKWTMQVNSMGAFVPIPITGYSHGADHSLVIESNVLANNLSMLYRVQIVYHDTITDKDILIQADMELVKLTNGTRGGKGDPGTPGENGLTPYFHTAWANNEQGTEGFSTTVSSGKLYIGTYTDYTESSPEDPTKYDWIRIKGDKGDSGYTPVKGTDYFDGAPGQDGESSYLWVRYSQNSNGSPMATNPSNAVYIGTATTTTATAPGTHTDYTWVKIKGDQGVPGETGGNGLTSYLHIKYSNDGGTTFTANNGETVGDWIGTYVDFESADSVNVGDYTWNKVKGEDGVGIESITEYYRVHTANTGIIEGGTGWLTTIPTLTPTNKYLWNYERVTYTNGVPVDLQARVIGVYGDTGTSIDKIEEFYLVSPNNTGITHSTIGWSSAMAVPSAVNKYIWNYEKITYKNPTSVENKAPRIIGVYGDRGEQGPRGLEGLQGPEGKQGIQGPAGADGRDSYTHIAYATGDQGQSFSHDTFPQATYIGMYASSNQNSSGNWGDYKWTLIRGKDGSQGIPGPKGEDGQTPYFHTAWANSADGSSGFSTTVSTDKLYIGTYTSYVSADSANPVDYSWTRIKGDKGDKGEEGRGILDIAEYYRTHTLNTGITSGGTGWDTTIPTLSPTNKYLWNYERVLYTDGTQLVMNARVIGVYGDRGTQGETGTSIDKIEEFYLTTSASTGITHASSGWGTTMVPPTTTNKYIWNYERITYKNPVSTENKAPRIIGVHGDTGPQGPQGLRGLQGPQGDQGIRGPVGENGISSYTHIAYADNDTGTLNFSHSISSRDYIGMYVDSEPTSSGDASKYKWTLVKGADGSQGVQGPKGTDGLHSYFHTAWANNSVGTAGFSTTISTDKLYIGTYTDFTPADSDDPSVYNWTRIKGDKGDKGDTGSIGPQGVQGPKGADGQTTYTWIRYADDINGGGINNIPTGKTHIGFAYNKITPTESNTPTDYTWALIKGEQGNQGVQGPKGIDGQTTYTWIKYSPNSDGSGMTDVSTATTKYIGIAPNKTVQDESTSPNDYTWSKFVGEDGVGVQSITEYYRVHTSNTGITAGGSGWSTIVTNMTPTNRFLWNYERITYTDGTGVNLDARVIGVYGERGGTGETGTSIDKIEEFYLTTTTSSGITHSSTGWSNTLTAPTSTNKYIWNYERITYKNPVSVENKAPRIIGVYGDTGPQGPQGPQGATGARGPIGPQGTSVSSIVEHYLATNLSSGITTSSSGWGTSLQPITSTNKYLWNYEKINFSDGTSQNTIPVIMGVYGDTGPQGPQGSTGSTGATGRSITGITEYYLVSNLPTGITRTSGEWSTTMQPTTQTNKYLWNYEMITWSSGTTPTFIEPIIIGVHGDKGDKGVPGDNAVLLTIETPDGTAIRNSTGTLRAVSELYEGVSIVTAGITYKWYKRLPGASGDADSGIGWQRLTSTTNFGTTGYDTSTLTIPPQAITGNATYMVIVAYQGTNFRRQVTVNDITDPYTVAVLGDSFFRNGQGQNTYTAKVYRNGEEVDANGNQGYTYTWHHYTSSGTKVSGFEKTGKVIAVTSSEFSGQGDLRVTVSR